MATYWEIIAHSAYEMFSWYKWRVVSLFFSPRFFLSGNLFLIVPFPDRCLLVPFAIVTRNIKCIVIKSPF